MRKVALLILAVGLFSGCGAATPAVQACMEKAVLTCAIQYPGDVIAKTACLQKANEACVAQ